MLCCACAWLYALELPLVATRRNSDVGGVRRMARDTLACLKWHIRLNAITTITHGMRAKAQLLTCEPQTMQNREQ
jgi:hypothetical protein